MLALSIFGINERATVYDLPRLIAPQRDQQIFKLRPSVGERLQRPHIVEAREVRLVETQRLDITA